jgi:hypothetical protein
MTLSPGALYRHICLLRSIGPGRAGRPELANGSETGRFGLADP